MTTQASDAVRTLIDGVLNAAPGTWRVQFGAWRDGAKTDRYAVVKPAGGLPAELVREPQFVVSLVGAENEAAAVAGAAADAVIEAMRSSSGSLVFMQAAEPSYIPTADGRHAYEFAVSAMTN